MLNSTWLNLSLNHYTPRPQERRKETLHTQYDIKKLKPTPTAHNQQHNVTQSTRIPHHNHTTHEEVAREDGSDHDRKHGTSQAAKEIGAKPWNGVLEDSRAPGSDDHEPDVEGGTPVTNE